MQFQIILSGKNKKYNKLSAVELARGKLIQLYLVGVGEFLVETICRKNQSFIYWKNMKNVSLCSPVFLCTRHRAKLRREVTLPMKNI